MDRRTFAIGSVASSALMALPGPHRDEPVELSGVVRGKAYRNQTLVIRDAVWLYGTTIEDCEIVCVHEDRSPDFCISIMDDECRVNNVFVHTVTTHAPKYLFGGGLTACERARRAVCIGPRIGPTRG